MNMSTESVGKGKISMLDLWSRSVSRSGLMFRIVRKIESTQAGLSSPPAFFSPLPTMLRWANRRLAKALVNDSGYIVAQKHQNGKCD